MFHKSDFSWWFTDTSPIFKGIFKGIFKHLYSNVSFPSSDLMATYMSRRDESICEALLLFKSTGLTGILTLSISSKYSPSYVSI